MFLDEVLSLRVNKWQNWVCCVLVLVCHLVEENNMLRLSMRSFRVKLPHVWSTRHRF